MDVVTSSAEQLWGFPVREKNKTFSFSPLYPCLSGNTWGGSLTPPPGSSSEGGSAAWAGRPIRPSHPTCDTSGRMEKKSASKERKVERETKVQLKELFVTACRAHTHTAHIQERKWN